MLEFIRASSLQGFPVLVRSLGGDPAPLLAASGIEPDVVGDHDAYLPYPAVADAVDRAARVFRCPDFGLRLSTHQGIEILGAVALIARHAETVGEGMRDLGRYLHVYSPAIGISLEALRAGEARFTFSILTPGVPARAQIEELSIGVSLRVFRLLIGPGFRPLRVAIPHAPLSSPARYRAFFDADVHFEQGRSGFDLRSADLERPVAPDDTLLRDLVTQYLTAASGAGDDLEAVLRALVARALPTGRCTITALARELAMHPRTLQRRLAASGLAFSDVVDSVRREQAHRFLTETRLPLSQVSALVGYTEQSSLTRACHGWFGAAPSEVRRPAGQVRRIGTGSRG